MKVEKSQAGDKYDKIRQKLRERLALNNIHSQIKLIPSMNKHLEISIEAFMRIDILSNMSKEEIITVVKGIPFLKYIKKSEKSQRQCFRLEYENSNRIILITGIQVKFIENILTQFNSYSRRFGDLQKVKGTLAKITLNTPFWIGIEAVSEQAADSLKKFLRNQKRNLDQLNKKVEYKIENRRIRIIIVKEDLFTLFVDAMTEHKAILFHKQFEFRPLPIDRNKNQVNIVYRPFLYNNVQNYSNRTDNKQQEFSDGFSESNSLNSDLFDPNKIKDIIQTSEQGIQSENSVSNPVICLQDQPQYCEPPRIQISPSKSSKEMKNNQQDTLAARQQQEHQKQVIMKSQIIRSNDDQFGLCQEEVDKQFQSPKKTTKIQETYDVCTQKISPIYNRHQIMNQQLILNATQVTLNFQSGAQTQEPLYNIIPDHLMRKCLQQFKGKPHSQLIQIPEWLKSESQNQRNRHRFFSSLCKPKLIHRHQPF